MKLKNSQKSIEAFKIEDVVRSIYQMAEFIEFRIFFISLLPSRESYRMSQRDLVKKLERILESVERLETYLGECGDIPTSTQRKSIKGRLARLDKTIENSSKFGIAIVFGKPQILTKYLEKCYGYIQEDVPFGITTKKLRQKKKG